MNHLRVCWENPDGSFNCGRCGKCTRTKVGLALAGAESVTLPGTIDEDAARRMKLMVWDRRQLRDGLAAMQKSGNLDAGVRKALRKAIRRSYFHSVASSLRSRI